MLTVRTLRSARDCEGTTRRDFLRVGSLALGGLTLPQLMRARAQPRPRRVRRGDRRKTPPSSGCGSAAGRRTSRRSTRRCRPRPSTAAPSVRSRRTCPAFNSAAFTQMAKVADKMAFVRSFAHNNSGHGGGTHFVMTGYDFRRRRSRAWPPTKPSYGSITARSIAARATPKPACRPTFALERHRGPTAPRFSARPYAPFDTGGQARTNMNLHARSRSHDRSPQLAEQPRSAQPRSRRLGPDAGSRFASSSRPTT